MKTRKPHPASSVRIEGKGHYLYARHPLTKRTTAFSLGDDETWRANLAALNRVLTDPELWYAPPTELQGRLREQWTGTDSIIIVHGLEVRRGKAALDVDAGAVAILQAELDASRSLTAFNYPQFLLQV